MPTMQEVRAKYPQYNDMTDEQLAEALHRKFYSDMPFDEFAAKIGLSQVEQPAQEMSWADTGVDALKSMWTGLVHGAAGLAALPQDLGRWAGGNVAYGIDRLMGQSPEEAQATFDQMQNIQGSFAPPSSQQMVQGVESVTGPLHQPQTTTGEYARTIGEFVPSALAGPGSLLRKGLLAVVPAVTSETAGQATEGEWYEPYARLGGALLGGIAASTKGNVGTKQMLKDAPSRTDVARDAKAAYDAIDNAGIVFDPLAYKSTAMKLKADLAKKGWDKLQGGQVGPLVNRIDSMLKPRAVSDWTKVDGILKDAKGILRSNADETTKMHAGIIVSQLEDLVKNGKTVSRKGTLTRPQINETIDRARELARRNIIARDIEKMKNKSEWYLSGPESGLRNQFKNYGKKNYQSLTDAEERAFKSVVNREGILNPLHSFGGRLGMTVLGSAGLSMGSPTMAIASIIGTQAARKFMEVYTMKGVDKAIKTVLAGKSAQQRAAVLDALSRGQGRLQSLLAADSGRISAQEPFLTDAKGREYPYPKKPALLGQ
jgi:hypothetical protein